MGHRPATRTSGPGSFPWFPSAFSAPLREPVPSWGVFDVHGNLHEWVADVDGTFRGGFYADAVLNGPGCLYRTTAHAGSYHDYSTGFRCCADR